MTSPQPPDPDLVPDADAVEEETEFEALASLDPHGFAEAWMSTAAAALKNPEGMAQAWSRYVSGLAEASAAAAERARGAEAAGPVQPGRRDRRFRDPAWEENPAFFAMLQAYLLSGRLVGDVLDASEVDEVTEHRMGFLADVMMDALAPTNILLDEPAGA